MSRPRILVTCRRRPLPTGKILATHQTYRSRAEEYKMARMPSEPSYFMKPPSSLSGHLAPVVRPPGCRFLNHEGEVAVVIGRRCHRVSVEHALDYVGGYTVANDWGVHDFRQADRGSMLRVKGQDGFCPLGPVMVDPATWSRSRCGASAGSRTPSSSPRSRSRRWASSPR